MLSLRQSEREDHGSRIRAQRATGHQDYCSPTIRPQSTSLLAGTGSGVRFQRPSGSPSRDHGRAGSLIASGNPPMERQYVRSQAAGGICRCASVPRGMRSSFSGHDSNLMDRGRPFPWPVSPPCHADPSWQGLPGREDTSEGCVGHVGREEGSVPVSTAS